MNLFHSFINDISQVENAVIWLFIVLVLLLSALLTIYAYRAERYQRLFNHFHKESRMFHRQKNIYENELKTFANMMDEITLPIWQRDKDMNIIYCNRRFCEVTGEIRENIINGGNVELFRDSRELATRAIKTGQFQVIEQNIVIGGSNTLNQVVEIPISDKNAVYGAKNGTIGFALNLIELQNTRERLKLNLELQKRLLDSLNSAVAIYGVNQKLEYYNRAFLDLWKLNEDWLRTHPTYGEILETLREKRKLPEQLDFNTFKRDNVNMFSNLISKKEDYYYLSDGQVVKVIIIPYQNRGLLFYYEDLTNQLSLERKYNTLVSVQRHTLDNLNESVAVFGEDGKLELFNPNFARLWNFTETFLQSEPHVSRILDEMVSSYSIEDAKVIREDFIAALNGRNFIEKKMNRKDGVVLIERFTPLPDGACLVTYFNITDKENVERSLRAEKQAYEEADKIKTNFLGNVSYELRSPLTSIMGFAEMMLANMGTKLDKKGMDYTRVILDSSFKLKSLIDNIIDVSTFDAGYVDLTKARFNIAEMMESLIDDISNEVAAKKVSIKLNISDDVKNVIGDRVRLLQAIRTIISCSVIMSAEKQKVDVKVTKKGENIHFEVKDKGTGISEKDIPLIFDQFYKMQTESLSSSGLGLYLAKKIIDIHGGSISVESQPEHGTKFTFDIPVQ